MALPDAKQVDHIHKTLGDIGDQLSKLTGKPFLIMWGAWDPEEDLTLDGVHVSGELTWGPASRIATGAIGNITNQYGFGPDENDPPEPWQEPITS